MASDSCNILGQFEIKYNIAVFTMISSGDPHTKSMPHDKNPRQKVEELNKFPLLLSVRSGAAVSMVRSTFEIMDFLSLDRF